MSPMFVGREEELALLLDQIGTAADGAEAFITISGEAGIGKSRLVHEIGAAAVQRGFLMLDGECVHGHSPPYWVWTQVVRRYVGAAPRETVAEQLAADAELLARVFPELDTNATGSATHPSVELTETTRFRFLDAFGGWLERVSVASPLFVVLEDLHWADEASLGLLQFLANRIKDARLVVVGTYRDNELRRGHPLATVVSQMARRERYRRIPLAGLARSAVQAYLTASLGDSPRPELVDSVLAHTEGNALFLVELVAHLASRAAQGQDAVHAQSSAPYASAPLPLPLPQGVKEIIGERLDRLSQPCVDLLRFAAVFGLHIPTRLLLAVVGPSDPLQTLQEALESGMLRQNDGRDDGPASSATSASADSLRFSHAIVQQGILEELSLTERVQHHAQIARALEPLAQGDRSITADRLVYHLEHAQLILGTEQLVHYALLAGDDALGRYGYEAAAAHYRLVLDVTGESTSAHRAAAHRGVGRSLALLQGPVDDPTAAEHLLAAFDLYQSAGLHSEAVQLAVELPLFGYVDQAESYAKLTKMALALTDRRDPDRVRLQALNGLHRYFSTWDADTAFAHYEAAEARADATDDAAAGALVHAVRSITESFELHNEDALRSAEAALAGLADDASAARALVQWRRCMTAAAEADASVMVDSADALRGMQRQFGDQYHRYMCFVMSLLRHLWLGDLSSAREVHERATAEFAEFWPLFRPLIALEEGRPDEAQQFYDSTVRSPLIRERADYNKAFTAECLPVMVRLGAPAELLASAEELGRRVLSASSVPNDWLGRAHSALAQAAIHRGDLQQVAESYAVINGLPRWMPIGVPRDRLLAMLADALGDSPAALRHIEDALERYRRSGFAELAWVYFDYGRILAHRPDTHPQAAEQWEQASALATRLHMQGLLNLIDVEQRAASAPRPAGLTAREAEVLELIALGLMNKEIASTLSITAKTVSNHLVNIFEKTGCSNRTEAATFAIRVGLAHSENGSRA